MSPPSATSSCLIVYCWVPTTMVHAGKHPQVITINGLQKKRPQKVGLLDLPHECW